MPSQNSLPRTRWRSKPYDRPSGRGPSASASSTTIQVDDPTEYEPKWDPEWNEGDFELVSSDAVHFSVPSFYLYSASAQIRNARELDDGSPKKIEFTDATIETAEVIGKFLCLATGKCLDLDHEKTLTMERSLALFLRKWECEALLRALLLQIQNWLMYDHPELRPIGFWTWVVGAMVEDMPTCIIGILAGNGKWPKSAPDLPNKHRMRAGARCFDPTSWSEEVWELAVGPKYMWALTRALGDVGDDGEAFKLAMRFGELMKGGQV